MRWYKICLFWKYLSNMFVKVVFWERCIDLLFQKDGSVSATPNLKLVHSDVCGPMWTPSLGNSLHFVTVIHDFSRFTWVYLLKTKSDVFVKFQHFLAMAENQTGYKVQTLCTY